MAKDSQPRPRWRTEWWPRTVATIWIIACLAIAVEAYLKPRGHTLFNEKLLYLETELALRAELRCAIFIVRHWYRLRSQLRQLRIRVAMSLRLEALGILGNGRGEDKLAFQLAAVFGEVFFFQDER